MGNVSPSSSKMWITALRSLSAAFRTECVVHAQAVAFSMFVAFFPALVFLIGIGGFSTRFTPMLQELLIGLRLVLPPGSRRVVGDFFLVIMTNPYRPLLLGFLGTIAVGSQVMMGLMQAFESIYDTRGNRRYWQKQVRAISLIFITAIPWMAASVLIVFGKQVRGWMVQHFGLARILSFLWSGVYLGVAFVTAVLILALIYRLGVGRKQSWDCVVPGAVLATGLWVLVSSGFGFYVRKLAAYNLLYGTFAAAIGLLVWMYLTSLVLLVGADFNARLERQSEANSRV